MWILFLIPIYIVSAFAVYRYHKIAYSKGGIWEYLNPSTGDSFIVFTPVINTLAAIIFNLCGKPK